MPPPAAPEVPGPVPLGWVGPERMCFSSKLQWYLHLGQSIRMMKGRWEADIPVFSFHCEMFMFVIERSCFTKKQNSQNPQVLKKTALFWFNWPIQLQLGSRQTNPHGINGAELPRRPWAQLPGSSATSGHRMTTSRKKFNCSLCLPWALPMSLVHS